MLFYVQNGYPDKFKKNIEIKNLNKIKLKFNNFFISCRNKKKNKKIYAVGGRVLNFVSLSDDFKI